MGTPSPVLMRALILAWCLSTLPLRAKDLVAPTPIAPRDGEATLHVHPHLYWNQIFDPRATAMPKFDVQIATDAQFQLVKITRSSEIHFENADGR